MGIFFRTKVSTIFSNLADYVYTFANGGDADNIKTNYHKFVFNMSNLPEWYGFLDVSKFDGVGFNPSPTGVICQHFIGWNTAQEYTRCYYSGIWTPWISHSPKNYNITLTYKSDTEMYAEIDNIGIPVNLVINVKNQTPYPNVTHTSVARIGDTIKCFAFGGGFVYGHVLDATLSYF